MEIKEKITSNTIAIALIWLFHVSGIVGILYGNSQWFVGATPLNLTLSFVLLLWTSRENKKVYLVALVAFFVGMIAEGLGVHYGLIFGNYSYGDALGVKFKEVPILIGINWSILTICCAAIARSMVNNYFIRILLGVALMLLLDFVIEPIAPVLDFWEFEGGKPPLQNFIGWFLVALPLNILYQSLKIELKESYTHHLFFLQLLFFMILLLQLNTLQNAL